MRIGIVGGGISGMATAWMLQPEHEVTLLEREPRLGGHARTVPVTWGGHTVPVELGFKFYFERSYPYLTSLVHLLGLEARSREGSLTLVRGASTSFLPLRSWRDALKLLGRPGSLARLRELHRFLRSGAKTIAEQDWSMSLREHVTAGGYGEGFGPNLLYPLIAASWGTSLEAAAELPAYCVFKIIRRDDAGKLSYLEIPGGVSRYIEALARELGRVDVRLGVTACEIRRDRGGLQIVDEHGNEHDFDHLVLATSAEDAAGLLDGDRENAARRDCLRRFRHFHSEIAIHSDPDLMPPRRDDWSLLNQFHEPDRAWMSEWAGRDRGVDVFRTWLMPSHPSPRNVHHRAWYHHLIVTKENRLLQDRLAELQPCGQVSTVGMYMTDVDTHESALASVFPVVRALSPGSVNLARLSRSASRLG